MQSVFEKLALREENPGVFAGEWRGGGAKIDKISPIDGTKLASVRTASDEDYQNAVARAKEAFEKWRKTPGPVRGDTVRRLGNALRELKHELGQLVTLETGKIIAEGEGEVQEMIDICDFGVGQSRMLYGLTIQSERPSHRLMEQWHPLGLVAVITAFNFPVAVWSWNNALIVCPTADLEMATQSIFFGAVGTAGQRCTSTRRVIMHESVADKVRKKLLAAYKSVPIGNPLEKKTLMGPLIDKGAVDMVQNSIQKLKDEGGEVLYGGERVDLPGGCYMKPCLANAKPTFKIVQDETFGPLLYLLTYRDFDEAIAIQNGVPQGLTSSIFTNDVREAEKFVSAVGSDCGIANINTGTSGAEIGGAFGGEKETGGGRESGSDVWKTYMRRQTVTINYSTDLPLAQGIQFGGDDAGSATA